MLDRSNNWVDKVFNYMEVFVTSIVSYGDCFFLEPVLFLMFSVAILMSMSYLPS